MPVTKTVLLSAISVLLWSSLATLGQKLNAVPPFLLVGAALGFGCLPALGGIRGWFARPALTLFGTAGIFGYHLFLFLALRLAPPVGANLINYLWPIGIVLFSAVLLPGYSLKPRHVAGALIAFAGAALVITNAHEPAIAATGGFTGYLLAFLAAVVWSLYSVLTKKILTFPTSAVGGFCFVSSILALLTHAWIEPSYSPTAQQWALIAALGFGPLGIAFLSWDAALKQGDPRVIAAVSYFTPLLSTTFLCLATRSPLGLPELGAAVLILGGAFLSTFRGGFRSAPVSSARATS